MMDQEHLGFVIQEIDKIIDRWRFGLEDIFLDPEDQQELKAEILNLCKTICVVEWLLRTTGSTFSAEGGE